MNRCKPSSPPQWWGTMTLGSTAASAQALGYDASIADQAYRSTHRSADQAHHDEHEAGAAAYRGDYRAADHYAEAADRHRLQAAREATSLATRTMSPAGTIGPAAGLLSARVE